MLEQGKTRQEIIDIFMQRLRRRSCAGRPPDRGFNRLAWALPYGLGLAGAGALAYTAWRFSKKSQDAAGGETAGRPHDRADPQRP